MTDDDLQELKHAVGMAALPSWLAEQIPPPRPQLTIGRFTGENCVEVLNAQGDSFGEYPSVEEAYRAVKTDEVVVTFDESVNGFGGELHDDSFFVEAGESGLLTFLSGLTDETMMENLQEEYLSWLELDQKWRQASQDWSVCYQWLNCHPIFWVKHVEGPSLFWHTASGLQTLWHDVGYDEDTTVVMLEHGPHCEPHYLELSHDLRLDVYAPTFEEAFVKLAHLVDKFYDVDGTEREGVEYEPSEWEKEITRRIKEVFPQSEEDDSYEE